jgi:hypothetical protein
MLNQVLRQVFTIEIHLTICHNPTYKGHVEGDYKPTSVQTQYINYPKRDLLSGLTKFWFR